MANQFQQTQYQFAAYIRDPEHQAIPDQIESRRMAIYRDLFFNNINIIEIIEIILNNFNYTNYII